MQYEGVGVRVASVTAEKRAEAAGRRKKSGNGYCRKEAEMQPSATCGILSLSMKKKGCLCETLFNCAYQLQQLETLGLD